MLMVLFSIVHPPKNVQEAFRGCNKLKRLSFDALDRDTLANLLPHLYLPALKNLCLPYVTDTPRTYWGRQPQTHITVDFIKRHIETLELFDISDMRITPKVCPRITTRRTRRFQ